MLYNSQRNKNSFGIKVLHTFPFQKELNKKEKKRNSSLNYFFLSQFLSLTLSHHFDRRMNSNHHTSSSSNFHIVFSNLD